MGTQYILGLVYAGQHDASAALLKDGRLVAYAEEERFSRLKFDRSFPTRAIGHCLDTAGISVHDVAAVGYFIQPWRGIAKRMCYALAGLPDSLRRGSHNSRILAGLLSAERVFRKETGYAGPFHQLDHHLTHAAAAFFSSPFEQSAILSVDGTGETETCFLGSARDCTITRHAAVAWPHSLGHMYAAATEFLGFKSFSDEYKVMGLAPYGKPAYLDVFRDMIRPAADGLFTVDLSFAGYPYNRWEYYSAKWLSVFGPPRKPEDPILDRHRDIAASLQARTEEVMFDLCNRLKELTGEKYLCLTGGVALNSVAVGKLIRSGLFSDIYTTPVSADAGCAMGAALYIHHIIRKNARKYPLPHAYWGSGWTDSEVRAAITASGLAFETVPDPAKTAAALIRDGHIVGWFQGRSEAGQRALGNRSILADPRDDSMKARINARVKYREPFRPFAPSLLESHMPEYFGIRRSVPFMTEVHPILPEKRSVVPAVTHVDGTGRPQTVTERSNPLYYKLIREFRRLTGIPMVLNTSFNVRGEPIVDSPRDAIRTFVNCGLDDLVMHSYWIRKSPAKGRS